MSVTGEAMRAMGESRNWYARQSQMTVFGTVPSLQDVQQNFSDCLAMAVGLSTGAQPAIALPSKPQSPAAAGWAPTLTEVTK